MKKVMLLVVCLGLGLASYAQNDTVTAKQFDEWLKQSRKEQRKKEFHNSVSKKFDRIIEKKIHLLSDAKFQDSIYEQVYKKKNYSRIEVVSIEVDNPEQLSDMVIKQKYSHLHELLNNTSYENYSVHVEKSTHNKYNVHYFFEYSLGAQYIGHGEASSLTPSSNRYYLGELLLESLPDSLSYEIYDKPLSKLDTLISPIKSGKCELTKGEFRVYVGDTTSKQVVFRNRDKKIVATYFIKE